MVSDRSLGIRRGRASGRTARPRGRRTVHGDAALGLAPTLSVIIPTFNRKYSLQRTLDSLSSQTFLREGFEVIVVDDGSADDTETVARQRFPFAFRYARQEHEGATAARNRGAAFSQADVLVFIDDDVTVSPQTLEAFAEVCGRRRKVLVMGRLYRRSRISASVYSTIMLDPVETPQAGPDEVELPFTECNTELLACTRSDFLALDMLQDPTEGAGWPNWDDVDFGYRAHRNGFRLLQSGKAIGEHWDHSASDRIVDCQRWFQASRSAVWLFKRHPDLVTWIPMLRDKTPIAWGQDSPVLVARKLARQVLSSPLGREAIAGLTRILERHYPSPAALGRLYYWLQGACMFHGYREGLREIETGGAHARSRSCV